MNEKDVEKWVAGMNKIFLKKKVVNGKETWITSYKSMNAYPNEEEENEMGVWGIPPRPNPPPAPPSKKTNLEEFRELAKKMEWLSQGMTSEEKVEAVSILFETEVVLGN